MDLRSIYTANGIGIVILLFLPVRKEARLDA